jgi:hypothetical protein
MFGSRVLVWVMFTCQVINHISYIDLPKEVIKRLNALLCAYLWAGYDKVTCGKVQN